MSRSLGWIRHRHIHAAAGAAGPAGPAVASVRWRRAVARLLERLGRAAVAASERPGAAVWAVLALNLGLAAVLSPVAYAATGDQALFYRELMPGTWLSFAELLFVSVIAWEAHRRDGRAHRPDGRTDGWRRCDNFWALTAGVFVVLAVDEITQATMFLSKWASAALDVSAPAPFTDVDAVFLVALLSACAFVVARRATILLRHRRALVLLTVAGLLGVASQAIDSLVPVSGWETVVEDTLKLAALPFFVGGYLSALRDVIAPAGPAAVRPAPVAPTARPREAT